MIRCLNADVPCACGWRGGSFPRRIVAVPMLLFALSAPAGAQELRVSTGPPELRAQVPGEDASWWNLFDAAQYEDFTEKTRGRGPALNALPPLSDAARFGYKFTDNKTNRHFVVDVAESGGYVLYADLNANDNLLDDLPRDLDPWNGYHTTRFALYATETWEGQEHTLPVAMQLYIKPVTDPETGAQTLQFWWDTQTVRHGTIRVGDTVTEFAVFGNLGRYGEVWFDLDGDGRGMNDRRSDEQFLFRDEVVTIGGRAYRFDIDRYGRHLILEPRGRGVARPSIAIGSVAPDFQGQGVDGRTHRLSDYRGKVVVLDFYAAWCGPCVADTVFLSDLSPEYYEHGLVILAITNDEPALIRRYREKWGPSFPVILDGDVYFDGDLHRLYQVKAYPTFFVVGKDGTIIGGRINHDTFEDELREALELPARSPR